MTRRSDARIVVDVRWEKDRWAVRFGDGPTDHPPFYTKNEAVRIAVLMADELTMYGAKTQVRVWTRRGTIAYERTYGDDPKRRKG